MGIWTPGGDSGQMRPASLADGWAMLDARARQLLGISAQEFLSRWDAGDIEDPNRPEVLRVAMLIPFVRPDTPREP